MRKRNFGLAFFETSTLRHFVNHTFLTMLREAPAVSRCSRSLVAKLLVATPFFICTIVYRDVCNCI